MSYMGGPLTAAAAQREAAPLGPNQEPIMILLSALQAQHPANVDSSTVRLIEYLTEAYERANQYVHKAGLDGVEQLQAFEVSQL